MPQSLHYGGLSSDRGLRVPQQRGKVAISRYSESPHIMVRLLVGVNLGIEQTIIRKSLRSTLIGPQSLLLRTLPLKPALLVFYIILKGYRRAKCPYNAPHP
ncbi:MAG: hypothetical protein WCE81_08170 [Halobacteriota archaeon]